MNTKLEKSGFAVFGPMFIAGLKGRLKREPCANNFRHTFNLFEEMNIHAKNFQVLRECGCRCDCDVLNALEENKTGNKSKKLVEAVAP